MAATRAPWSPPTNATNSASTDPPVRLTSRVFNDAPTCSFRDSASDVSGSILLDTTAGGIELYTRTDRLNVTLTATDGGRVSGC